MYRLTRLFLLFLICQIMAAVPGLQQAAAAVVLFRQGVGGIVRDYTIRPDDSLIELARRNDVGYNEITDANPGVDPFVPEVGTRITVPGRWILPDVPEQRGIVINVAEMRLYYFPPHSGELLETFPIGIGDEGWDTPLGTYHVIEKIVSPAWHVPASIRAQKPDLPAVVPAGPENPLGSHALRLSIGTVLIHGTDRPFGIGRRVSHGCIHLYPEDIPELFKRVPIGTSVTIVRQQVKAAVVDGRVLVEIHQDGGGDLAVEAYGLLERKGLMQKVDRTKLKAALTARSGIPVDITGGG